MIKRYEIIFGALLLLMLFNPGYGRGETMKPLPFKTGEEIRYNVKKFGVKAGTATLRFEGQTQLNGKSAYLIVFTVKGLNFFDEERIYVDPYSFLPIQVDRDVNVFGKEEKITEVYDHQAGQVVLTKKKGDREVQETIEKQGKIENIYGFIYRYRRDGSFGEGETIKLSLPTKDMSFQLEGKEKISLGRKQYEAYIMESHPRQFRVWFDESPKKIPLRIDGAMGFGQTSMVLAQYDESRPEQVKE